MYLGLQRRREPSYYLHYRIIRPRRSNLSMRVSIIFLSLSLFPDHLVTEWLFFSPKVPVFMFFSPILQLHFDYLMSHSFSMILNFLQVNLLLYAGDPNLEGHPKYLTLVMLIQQGRFAQYRKIGLCENMVCYYFYLYLKNHKFVSIQFRDSLFHLLPL